MDENDDSARQVAEETAELARALRQSESRPDDKARDLEERINTREHHLIQRVLKRERSGGRWKILGVAGSAIALMQFFNAAGPCSNGWKFKTIDDAAQDHAAIRADMATSITRVEDKIDSGNAAVLKAIVEISTKKGKTK